MADLSGKHVAMIVDNYIEESELVKPKEALEAAGATVDIIAPQGGNVQTMQNDVEMASTQQVDHTFDEIDLDNYDAMVVPGGAINADHLRTSHCYIFRLRTAPGNDLPRAVGAYFCRYGSG